MATLSVKQLEPATTCMILNFEHHKNEMRFSKYYLRIGSIS